MTNITYTKQATKNGPALILFVLDLSLPEQSTLTADQKIRGIQDYLRRVCVRMVQFATKGRIIAKRYRLSIIGYHATMTDLLGGIQDLETLAQNGIPQIALQPGINPTAAFTYVTQLLQEELPLLENSPAPLVCHLIDNDIPIDTELTAAITGLMQLAVPDGNVLIENILLSYCFAKQKRSSNDWAGVIYPEQLPDNNATQWFTLSSTFPHSYLLNLNEYGYTMKPGCKMLLPRDCLDVAELALVPAVRTSPVMAFDYTNHILKRCT